MPAPPEKHKKREPRTAGESGAQPGIGQFRPAHTFLSQQRGSHNSIAEEYEKGEEN